jgi:two-component system alkaline phosphatase synthesis response regulator PhoP
VYSVYLLVNHQNGASPLCDSIDSAGFKCVCGSDLDMLDQPAEDGGGAPTEAVILDLESFTPEAARRFIERCKKTKLPIVAVVGAGHMTDFDPSLNPDEVVFSPMAEGELAARVKQAIFRVNGPTGTDLLRSGELTIDLERYEVSVAGRRVTLTYKEFQMLVLLASNPGHVYTREALLSEVWGYDYLGGTRTVDVHVRRLRSKVEAPGRAFVETVRNVGYRFIHGG